MSNTEKIANSVKNSSAVSTQAGETGKTGKNEREALFAKASELKEFAEGFNTPEMREFIAALPSKLRGNMLLAAFGTVSLFRAIKCADDTMHLANDARTHEIALNVADVLCTDYLNELKALDAELTDAIARYQRENPSEKIRFTV